MRSNYKRLGDYIQQVDERNRAIEDLPLLGLSISKDLIPSVANIIGTDLSNYKIIRNKQFAISLMQVSRDGKLPVAMFSGEAAIMSPAYPMFEVVDSSVLMPEYLMMWFSRSEFDREAAYYAVGGIRGNLPWEDFLDMRLPIPTPEKQREIVAEYNTVQHRIHLNEQLIQKLEETAQAIYREWFVEFEFPDDEGKPYKSSGGEMVKSEMGEIPKGWKVITIKELCKEMKSGGTPSRDNLNYWNDKDIPWLKTGEICNKVLIEAEEYISIEGCNNSSAKVLPVNTVLIAMYGEGKTKGQAGYLRFEAATNQACCAMVCKNEYESTLLYNYLRINQGEIANLANGGAQPNLSKELIENIKIIKPCPKDISKHHFVELINYSEIIERENQKLSELKELLLSKLARG